jgi:glycosyltransferase involved in cell wall biosynthesis
MARRLLIASQPLDAGVPNHILNLVSSLDPERWTLDVACPRQSLLWRRLEGRESVRLHAIQPHRDPSPADLLTLATLLRLARQADVVHAHSAKAGFLARLAAVVRGRRRNCVFTPHGWSFWSAQGRRAAFYGALERRAARWCEAIVALSGFERDSGLAARVGDRAQYRVIPNGVDTTRFAAEPAPVPGRVVMVGRLAAPKRHDLALHALARLSNRNSDAMLQVVGGGPRREKIVALADELGLPDRVRLLGARDDVPELLSRAACLVLVSDYEGCPLSVIEAMAAGVPVIASRVGGLTELVDHGVTGLLVPHDDPDALAAAVGELLADPERARRLGRAGRERARELYSIERMVAATVALYDEIGAGSAG